ncbi:MAG: PepSY domain-containing protein [Pyrinomonadaceae bacterium]|nr:PepSY domain-containing protein [Pyrinomonadaceae bacterium]
MKKIAALFLFTLLASGTLVAADTWVIGKTNINDHDQDNRGRRGRGRDDWNSNSNSNRSGGIASADARRAALDAVPGEIIKEEYENESGRAVYEFYIRKGDGRVYEVYVDAGTAKVVKIERK